MAKTKTVSEAGSLGGAARAKSMTAEERSESARKAVMARWEKEGVISPIPQATHGDPDHPLRIGETEIGCYVLETGQRVISQRSLQSGIGMNASGGAQRLLRFLKSFQDKGVDCKDLSSRITNPIVFRTPLGAIGHGYEATALTDLCDVILEARKVNALTRQQMHLADQSEILIRGLANVGIIALVDEATGYQYDRPRRDLEEHLKKFLSESLRRWVRTFPADYFKHLCRLRGVELRPDMRLPQYFGHLTNNLVYRRLAPGLLKKLQDRRSERGSSSNKLHSWLSSDVGVPEILVHLGTVVGLMKINTDYETFEKQLDMIAHIYPETPGLFDDPKDWEAR